LTLKSSIQNEWTLYKKCIKKLKVNKQSLCL
jgi:hypothetical protein